MVGCAVLEIGTTPIHRIPEPSIEASSGHRVRTETWVRIPKPEEHVPSSAPLPLIHKLIDADVIASEA